MIEIRVLYAARLARRWGQPLRVEKVPLAELQKLNRRGVVAVAIFKYGRNLSRMWPRAIKLWRGEPIPGVIYGTNYYAVGVRDGWVFWDQWNDYDDQMPATPIDDPSVGVLTQVRPQRFHADADVRVFKGANLEGADWAAAQEMMATALLQ